MTIEIDTIVKRAEELLQQTPVADQSQPLNASDGELFNQVLNEQCLAVGKRFPAMPNRGRWPNRVGICMERDAQYVTREDGRSGTDRDPIKNYANKLTLTPKDGTLTLKIEQIEALDGQTKLSSISVTGEERTVKFTPV